MYDKCFIPQGWLDIKGYKILFAKLHIKSLYLNSDLKNLPLSKNIQINDNDIS